MEGMHICMIIIGVVIIWLSIYFATKKEKYTVFFARTRPPNFMLRLDNKPDGALCLGQRTNTDGLKLEFNTNVCDEFMGKNGDLPNNELVSSRTGNSVSAYYNADANGHCIPYNPARFSCKESFFLI